MRRTEFNELSDQAKALEKEFKEATNTLTNTELSKMIEKLEKENTELAERVHGFKSGGIELVSEEQLNEAAQEGIYYA